MIESPLPGIKTRKQNQNYEELKVMRTCSVSLFHFLFTSDSPKSLLCELTTAKGVEMTAQMMYCACRALRSLGKCWLYIGWCCDDKTLTLALESDVFLNFALFRASVVVISCPYPPWGVDYTIQDRFNNGETQLQKCQSTSLVPA